MIQYDVEVWNFKYSRNGITPGLTYSTSWTTSVRDDGKAVNWCLRETAPVEKVRLFVSETNRDRTEHTPLKVIEVR